MPYKRLFFILLTTVVFYLSLIMSPSGCLSLPIDTHAQTNSISVLIDDNYPPYSFRNSSGQLQGISVDRWRLWEEKTGISVQLIGMPWDKCLQAFNKGDGDVMDTVFFTPDRAKIYDYSQPYAKIKGSIFFNRNISGLYDIDSLSGFSVAVKKGDSCIRLLQEKGISRIEQYDSYYDIIKAFEDKKVVVFIMDQPPAFYYLYKLGLFNQIKYSQPLYTGEFHTAVRKGNTALLQQVETGFDKISFSEASAIEKKWSGSPFMLSTFIKTALWLCGIISIILLLMVLWNKALQKNVKEKTTAITEIMNSLALSETKYRELVSNTHVGIVIYSPNREILLCNQAFLDLFGLTKKHLTDNSALPIDSWQLLHENCEAVAEDEYPEKIVISTGRPIHDIVYGIQRLNSHNIQWVQVNVFPEHDSQGQLTQLIMTLVDITELKNAEKLIYENSIHDPLTGLYNRSYFESQISSLHSMGFQSCGLVICDLDGLKLINDTLGHAKGDEYLYITGQVLLKSFRSQDTIARIGGDEFAVIVPNADEQEVIRLCECLQENINSYNIANDGIQLSVSYSHSVRYGHDINPDIMLKEADNYMYRVKLHRRQSIKSEIVQTVKTLLRERDLVTENHAERMQDLACSLAAQVPIRENEMSDIRLLAQFHDIGKVGIPDHILRKPARLNAEERQQMMRHAEIGARIAEVSADLMPIADGILKHHEWWNGQGYPLGLKGEEIPIQCRIISIIDAYDAMVNDRPYRKAMSQQEALQELEHSAGIQFDPSLVKKFISLFTDQKNI